MFGSPASRLPTLPLGPSADTDDTVVIRNAPPDQKIRQVAVNPSKHHDHGLHKRRADMDLVPRSHASKHLQWGTGYPLSAVSHQVKKPEN
jgi:hypothetical protein